MADAVVFAYSSVGHECLSVLIRRGVNVKLVYTHEDDPGETQWFESVKSLAASHNIPVRTDEPREDAVREMKPDVIFSFYYRAMIDMKILDTAPLGAFNMQSTLSGFSFYNSWTPCITGVILAVLFGATVLSGSHILITVTGLLVPFMSLMYIAVGLYIVGINYQNIPAMFSGIFADAFNFHAIFGGFSGSCLMYGVKRGLFSNEAGMGSAPNAAASADVSHPVKQGLVQMLSVFIDTLVLCTVTALMCLSTGIVPTAELAGAPYVQQTMHTALGDFGPIFIVVALSLFVFTTLIGNYYYSEGCLSYIMKGTPSRRFMTVFRLCASVLVLVGAMLSMELAWNTVDLTQALMVLINVPVIFLLARPAVAALRDYLRQRREGLDPHFHSEDIQLEGKTECWEREEG